MGTGTSQGVPMIAHHSRGLDLEDPRNWRTRTAAHVICGGTHIQIDAGPEFRLQCVHNEINAVDLFLLTHGHADHIMGMDDLRRFCDLRGFTALPVYSSPEGLERVRQVFPYALGDRPVIKGYPAFALRPMPTRLDFPGGRVESVRLPHGPLETLGLVFTEEATGQRLAYYTDCKELTPEAEELARGADLAVLDALRPEPHPSHMNIEEAVAAATALGAGQTWFVHMTYAVNQAEADAALPAGMRFAWDGLRIDLADGVQPVISGATAGHE